MSRPSAEHPLVRIMDGKHVEAVFHYVAGRWSERLHMSRAQSRYLARRAEELSHLSSEEQAAVHRRDDRGRQGRGGSHLVKLIGNEPLAKAYRPEWNRIPLRDIPGYREVYQLGRYRFGADTLFGMLDALRDHGITEIQLDALRKYATS